MDSLSKKEVFFIGVVITLFIVASVFTTKYADQLQGMLQGSGIETMILYVLIISIFVVTPLGSVVLIPVSVSLWGPVLAGILSMIGWVIGGLATYAISRHFGRPLVEKFLSKEQICKYEKLIPKKKMFLGLIVLNALLPGDALGYVLGIFVKVPYSMFAASIVIGNIPTMSVLVFASTLSIWYQILIGAIILVVLGLGAWKLSDLFLKNEKE